MNWIELHAAELDIAADESCNYQTWDALEAALLAGLLGTLIAAALLCRRRCRW